MLTCFLPDLFWAGVTGSSTRGDAAEPTDLLLPVCTIGAGLAACLEAEAAGDAFPLPCKSDPKDKSLIQSHQLCSNSIGLAASQDIRFLQAGICPTVQAVIATVRPLLLQAAGHHMREERHSQDGTGAGRHLAVTGGLGNRAGLHASRCYEPVLSKAPIAQDALVACRRRKVVGLHLDSIDGEHFVQVVGLHVDSHGC